MGTRDTTVERFTGVTLATDSGAIVPVCSFLCFALVGAALLFGGSRLLKKFKQG